MTPRTPRRLPANRKGRRSIEHRKFKSPHEMSPGESVVSCRAEGLKSKETPYTWQDTDDAVPPVTDDEISANHKAAVNEETAATSSSSDGETTAMLQQAHQMQKEKDTLKTIQEELELEPRRSGRKRRPVEHLSPADELPHSKSPNKRRVVTYKTELVEALIRARPAVQATAAARAAAAKKEKKKKAQNVVKGKKTTPKKETRVMLSPVQDEKKKTPQKKRSSKARRSLEPAYNHETETEYVGKLIAELYEEQEQDDREMYNISRDTVVTETSTCKRSQEVQDLSMEEFRRLMTYGEVSVESVSATILPFLKLGEDDVFFDLGCGTGKILVQAALQTPCKTAIGIELMQNRVLEGKKALARLKERDVSILRGKSIEVLQGDICEPPEEAGLMNATVVFINNVMFGPVLMLKVLALLKDMRKLKRVVMLRKICERHGHEKCTRAGNYCVEYVHPPDEAEIDVSWADKTSVYLYENVEYSLSELTKQITRMQSPTTRSPPPKGKVKKKSSLVPPVDFEAKLDAVAS